MVIKPLGKTVGSLLLICDLTSLDNGDIFMGRGVYEQLDKFEIFTKMHFSTFCGIFKEGWYRK